MLLPRQQFGLLAHDHFQVMEEALADALDNLGVEADHLDGRREHSRLP